MDPMDQMDPMDYLPYRKKACRPSGLLGQSGPF